MQSMVGRVGFEGARKREIPEEKRDVSAFVSVHLRLISVTFEHSARSSFRASL